MADLPSGSTYLHVLYVKQYTIFKVQKFLKGKRNLQMKKSKKQKCAFDLLPFHVIEAASTGDTEAIQAVLKHYEGYITVLATRKMFDEFGQVHYCVDETLRQCLETKLITKTLGFDTKSYVRKGNQ